MVWPEKSDPFIFDNFGIDGMGEGLVLYPILHKAAPFLCPKDKLATFIFKAKGDKHSGIKQKKPVKKNAEQCFEMAKFTDMVCTEQRLQQGYQEVCSGEFDIRKTGEYIKWICNDVISECQAEIEASTFTVKQVTKHLSTHAALWFKQQGITV